MKICYDQGCNDIGVVIAMKWRYYLFYLQQYISALGSVLPKSFSFMARIERNYCFSYLTGLVVIFNYHLIEKRLMFWCFFCFCFAWWHFVIAIICSYNVTILTPINLIYRWKFLKMEAVQIRSDIWPIIWLQNIKWSSGRVEWFPGGGAT